MCQSASQQYDRTTLIDTKTTIYERVEVYEISPTHHNPYEDHDPRVSSNGRNTTHTDDPTSWSISVCGRATQRGRGRTASRSASLKTVRRLPLVVSSESPEFFGHRLQTSMARATVEDSTAGLGQTIRTGRPLVGGLSFHGVSGLCMSSLAHVLLLGIQVQSV